MIVRVTFVNNDNINNCKSISSNILHHLAFFCEIKMATTFYFSLFSNKNYILYISNCQDFSKRLFQKQTQLNTFKCRLLIYIRYTIKC